MEIAKFFEEYISYLYHWVREFRCIVLDRIRRNVNTADEIELINKDNREVITMSIFNDASSSNKPSFVKSIFRLRIGIEENASPSYLTQNSPVAEPLLIPLLFPHGESGWPLVESRYSGKKLDLIVLCAKNRAV